MRPAGKPGLWDLSPKAIESIEMFKSREGAQARGWGAFQGGGTLPTPIEGRAAPVRARTGSAATVSTFCATVIAACCCGCLDGGAGRSVVGRAGRRGGQAAN